MLGATLMAAMRSLKATKTVLLLAIAFMSFA